MSLDEMTRNQARILAMAQRTGPYGLFTIRHASYYPSERMKAVVAQQLYDVDYERDGLLGSARYREMETDHRTVDIGAPLCGSNVTGKFLYLPGTGNEPNLGMLLLDLIQDSRDDRINLSLISRRALAPEFHHVTAINGVPQDLELEVGRRYNLQFRTVDRDGSNWSLHC